MKTNLFSVVFFVLSIGAACAQDSIQKQIETLKGEVKSLKSEEKSHFMIRGFAQFGLDASSDNVNFNMTSFNPVLLWRQGDRFLFESELEMEYMNNQFSLNLGYANASYIVAKGLVIKVGKILIPFGTFGEKFHPSWVNKFASAPLGIGHDGMLPMADIGVEIRGGVQLGKSKLSYALYAVNGPRIKDGTEEPTEAGMLSFENATDNNDNKAIGSRIGLLPFFNSSLEIGVSAYYAMPGSAISPFEGNPKNQDLNYKNVTALLTAFDVSYVKLIRPLKGVIDIKGQHSFSNVSNATYFNPADSSRYTFTNKCSSYYAQLAYRPAMATSNVLKNFEVVGRYTVYTTPAGSLWYSNQSQIEVGLNYWFAWRTVLKASYQISDGAMGGSGMSSMAGMSNMRTNMFLIHLATGL
jgi:hypothetical protein